MSIYEYDQKKHLQMEREDALEEGQEKKLAEMIRKKLRKGKSILQIVDELEESEATIQSLIQKYTLCDK